MIFFYLQVPFSLLCHSIYHLCNSRKIPFGQDCMIFQGFHWDQNPYLLSLFHHNLIPRKWWPLSHRNRKKRNSQLYRDCNCLNGTGLSQLFFFLISKLRGHIRRRSTSQASLTSHCLLFWFLVVLSNVANSRVDLCPHLHQVGGEYLLPKCQSSVLGTAAYCTEDHSLRQ